MDVIALLKATTVDQLIIGLLVLSNIASWAKIAKLTGKYHQLNRLASNHAWIIRLKLGVTTIKQHRLGDFEIVEPLNEE